VPRVRATRDARDVDGVAAMRDVRALMSSRGRLWRRAAKPAEGERKLSVHPSMVDVDSGSRRRSWSTFRLIKERRSVRDAISRRGDANARARFFRLSRRRSRLSPKTKTRKR
jgi:hypothetical protein